MSFQDLGLSPKLLSALIESGFEQPTPVQAAAIPQALAGQDLMVSAQTGSGKTAAFMLPALNRIADTPANKSVGVQVLVLTPTRELAQQVTDATNALGKNLTDLRTATVVGGMPYGLQLKQLSRRVDVLVATPGRLIDHLNSGRVKLSTVHTLVLDEADRMLDMGFIEDIETIISRLPTDRQTLLFSATLDGNIARLAEKMMNDPQRIVLTSQKEKHDNITQSLLYADDLAHKLQLLDHVLRDTQLDQAIVFTSTKRGADELADHLSEQGFSAAALHGDMNQRQRTRTLTQLQRRQLRVLVATDVAARGIDVQGISHAVNFDLPMQAEDYVHRIGRTGRAGRSGLAFTLATHAERHKIRRIESYIGRPIDAQTIAGLEPKRSPRPETRGGSGKPFIKRGAGRGGFDNRSSYSAKPVFDARESRPSYGDRAQRDARAGFAGRDGQRGEPGARAFRPEGDRPAFGARAHEGNRPAFTVRAADSDRPALGARVKDDRPRRESAPGGFARPAGKPFEKRPGGNFARRFSKTAAA
jgi:superfamily II DNA/RNA helicase